MPVTELQHAEKIVTSQPLPNLDPFKWAPQLVDCASRYGDQEPSAGLPLGCVVRNYIPFSRHSGWLRTR